MYPSKFHKPIKTSRFLPHPDEGFLVIRPWMKKFIWELTDGNITHGELRACAGLLAYFMGGDDTKYKNYQDKVRKQISDGEEPNELRAEDLLQYHSLKDLEIGLVNEISQKLIQKSIKILQLVGLVEKVKPQGGKDRTNYYFLHAEPINDYLKSYEEQKK